MVDAAREVVEKRRQERLRRSVCTACGSASATVGHAEAGAPYRILRGGMHVGDAVLDPMDPLCRFCEASGQVKKYGIGGA